MSTSVKKIVKRYAIAAIGCALFALIYYQFSHGVHSPFMTFMFAIPLLGGAAIATGCGIARADLPRGTRQAWALAIASLTVASCLRGVFDIAGTASPLLIVYLIAAGALLVAGAVIGIRKRAETPRLESSPQSPANG